MANRETKSTKDRSKEKDSAPKRRLESDAERMPQFADGGMVRGCKPGQMSGKGFSGTY